MIETDIEHVDLDEDGDEDEPVTAVYVSIITADGMRYCASTSCAGDTNPTHLASMVLSSAAGAAATHSPELGDVLTRRLR